MADSDHERRALIALRLKAARWLFGTTTPTGRKAEPGVKPEALSAQDIAGRIDSDEKITANLIGSIERMERHTPGSELKVIADALGLPDAWFTERDLGRIVPGATRRGEGAGSAPMREGEVDHLGHGPETGERDDEDPRAAGTG